MFLLDNLKENCQRIIFISNLNAFTFLCGINRVEISENNQLGNGEKSQISRFRLVAHQN